MAEISPNTTDRNEVGLSEVGRVGLTVPKMPLFAAVVVAVCVLIGSVGYVPFVVSSVGSGPTAFIARQSEAYSMIALVVLFWALFAPNGHPAAEFEVEDRNPKSSAVLWFGWFVALILASVAMVSWDGAPGAFVTQKESTFAVLLISWYLGWSRGLRSKDATWRRGGPVQSAQARAGYYVAAIALTAIAYTSLPATVLGNAAGTWLAESNEGFVAALLIPLYFDIFSRSRGRAASLVWYGAMVFIPVSVQLNSYPEVFSSQVDWLGQVTEGFIAVIGISLFFDVLKANKS